MADMATQALTGPAQVEFCKRLGDDWKYLALALEIPFDEQQRFTNGDEPRAILEWLQRRSGLAALPDALAHIGRDELALRLRPPSVAKQESAIWRGKSPYPGLVAFSEAYAPVFFGREFQTSELIGRLKDPRTRFIAVVGASGSGKSSLVAAGLLPRLKQDAVPGPKNWQVLEFTPGGPDKDPFTPLGYKLEPLLKPRGWHVRDIVNRLRTRDGLALFAKELLEPTDRVELLLFVDQFEELFTLCESRHRAPFISMLDQAVREPRMRIIVTLRSDFFSPCLQYARLAELLNAGLYALPRAGTADLYQMIARPAAVVGLRFENEALVFRILEDTGTSPGALPLMASALAELYETRAPDGTLTEAAYDGFGGVKGVISKQATKSYDDLDDAAKGALSDVFKELVEVDPQRGIPTRKRAAQDDFRGMPAALRLIEAFTNKPLLVASEGTVEVAHEALLTHWEVLSQWIERRFDDFRLLRRVQLEAADWRRHRGYLWPHERLLPVYRMIERLQPKLTRPERAFIRPESDRLLRRIRNPATTHQERAKIGDRLAEMGDRRPGVGLRNDLADFVWCKVPGGEITLEGSKTSLSVPAFCIGKYPVTYVQYRSFLEAADGYRNKRWWQGLARRENQPESQYRQLDNHPAENVSWYDAVAFCRWLSIRLGYEVRLPTEGEWQQAATGGNPDNEYPWVGKWRSEYANTWESGLSRTTAVGMYPAGASPVGALDMAGNVWEWCLNEHDNPSRTNLAGDAPRVVRGGSWSRDRDYARAAFRRRHNPGNRSSARGFRVVCTSPIC